MPQKPYRITDRRSSTGYTNTLIEAATQTTDRQTAPMLDVDVHRSISSYGRRVLMTLGRLMFWRYPALQGAILEQANLAVSSFIPQYMGRNKDWGEKAEEVLREWHKVMDVAGWPYDYDSFLQGKIINPIVEGEDFTLLTQNADGYPLIQIIPCHRVGGRSLSNSATAKVRYTGEKMFIDDILVDENRPYPVDGSIEFEASIVDGVIVDFYARPLAYRVYDDSRSSGSYQDISARNLFPAFFPMATGQVRGFSLLASSVFDWQDMHEWSRFEMLAQKAFSTQTIIETNETGEADTAKQIISQAGSKNDDGTKATIDVEKLDGGAIRYLKAMTGSKLEAFDYDRPGAQSQNFLKTKLRDAFKGTEWDVFFSLDPQAVGGAPMRVIVEKINAVLAKKRKLVKKSCLRVDGFALSRFMKLGVLPWDDDWYKWGYQGPGDVTADKKYDSEVDMDEISQMLGTRKDAIARRGGQYDEVRKQRKTEAEHELEDAKALADKYKITIQEALVILRPPTRSAQMPQQSQPSTAPAE